MSIPSARKGTRPVAALAVLALLVFGLAPVGLAQDCPNRGLLDVMYCDADGDLVADAPTDPSQWVDPDTLFFAYTPVEDPAIYEDVWDPFIQHLAQVTGKNVRFFSRTRPRSRPCAPAGSTSPASPPARRRSR